MDTEFEAHVKKLNQIADDWHRRHIVRRCGTVTEWPFLNLPFHHFLELYHAKMRPEPFFEDD